MSPRLEQYTHEGLTFDVTDSGPEDGPVVILLHGFPEDRECWSGVTGPLVAAGFRVLAPDQRGYSPGARPAGRRAYALPLLAGDVVALAGAAGAERFDVVGHDWGGAVAWELAISHADRLRTVTALSTPHPRAFQSAMFRSSQLLHSWYMGFFQLPRVPELAMRAGGVARAEKMLARSGLDAGSAARYARRLVDPDALTPALNWYRALPFGGRVADPTVTVPTLYVWSDGDRFLVRKAAEATARLVSGPYRFEVLAGESHWLPSAAPGKVAGLLVEHLQYNQP